MTLTNIFPPETLPTRSGVYKTLTLDDDGTPNNEALGYSFFDATDRIWGCTYNNVDDAWKNPEYEFAQQVKQWCGLSEEPKA